jgi:hypothetical protein
MRIPRGLFLVLVILAAPTCTGRDATPGQEEAAAAQPSGTPEELVADWVRMWNQYDLDRVPSLFLQDDRVSYFSSEFEGSIQGFEGVLEHHRGFGFVPGGEGKGTRLWVEDLRGDRFGETAVLTGIWYFERLSGEESGATTPPQRGPVTFVCILQDDRWRFAHMNFGNYLDPEDG